MPSQMGMNLFAYDLTSGAQNPYGARLESLAFSTTAPGGFGDLTCRVKTNNARNVPPELRQFARVALVGGGFVAYLGRWDEPAIVLNTSDGDVWELKALGASEATKDDPTDSAYTNQTTTQILSDQLTGPSSRPAGTPARSGFLQLDSDTSAILPDSPTAIFSPAPNGQTFEQVLNDLLPLVQPNSGTADYTWGVWDHPTKRDTAGFPTWQLQVHQRDTTTVKYTAYEADIESYSIRPAVEYSYNVVTVKYRDATSNAPSSVTVRDSRLNADGTQGTAAFPWRKLFKDLSSAHLTSAEAANLANALLAQYQNGGFKVEATLSRVRDAYGNEIPLWQVRADGNIFLPQISPTGQTLPTTPTANVNVFYVHETHYSEAGGSTPKLTINANSFFDTVGLQIVRLQHMHERLTQDNKFHHSSRAAGEQLTGYAAQGWTAAMVPSGGTLGTTVNYGQTLSNTPSSITLTVQSSSNVSSVSATAATNVGFEFDVNVVANTSGYARYTWTTVGA